MGDVFGIGSLAQAGANIYGDQLAANAQQNALDWNKQVYGNQQGYMSPFVTTGQNANAQIGALLGVSGTPGQQAGAQNAFKNYLGSTGYQFNLQQGQNAINSNSAAKGLLNSGATGKALTAYGQNLGTQYFNNYLSQLSGLQGAGIQAGENIGNTGVGAGTNVTNAAGNYGNALYNEWGNIGNFLGGF